jgi:hypothetical protein
VDNEKSSIKRRRIIMIERNYSYKPSPGFTTHKMEGLWDFYKLSRFLGVGRFASWYLAWQQQEEINLKNKEMCKGYELVIKPNTNKGEK